MSSADNGGGGREELLERLLVAARKINSVDHLRTAVEHFEALQEDFAHRAQSDKEFKDAIDALLLARKPALIQQLAFYFCDANLRHDRFLRERITEGADGYVPLATLVKFNRMVALGCTGVEELAGAAASAPEEARLELSADRESVRRAQGKPLPPPMDARLDLTPGAEPRTVRVEGFPHGDGASAVTEEAVRELLGAYGPVEHVWLLRERTSELYQPFLGTAEVLFETVEAADALVIADPAAAWEGQPLSVKKLAKFRLERGGAINGEGVGSSLKRLREDPQQEAESSESKRARFMEQAAAHAERCERGCVIYLPKVPKGVTWKHIFDNFAVFGSVTYVDHQVDGDTETEGSAYVRMKSAAAASDALAAFAKTGNRVIFQNVITVEETVEEKAEEKSDKAAPAKAEEKEKGEDEGEVLTDPYGGGDVASKAATAVDEGEAAGGQSVEVKAASAADDAEDTDEGVAGSPTNEDPFVVDTEGQPLEVVTARAAASDPEVGKQGETSCPSAAVVLLAGKEEDDYLLNMAVKLQELRERREKGHGKDGKSGKGGKKGKAGKGKFSKGKKGGRGKKGRSEDWDSD